MALFVPAGIVVGGMLIVGPGLREALIVGGGAMFLHFIAYLVVAPLVFLFLGPGSDLWKYHWGVLSGGFLGAAMVAILLLGTGAQLHETGTYILVGAGYGYATAFSVVRAREKLLEQ